MEDTSHYDQRRRQHVQYSPESVSEQPQRGGAELQAVWYAQHFGANC